jgi:hypothetical protein
MADRSAIEWTEATWNPVTGCTKVSPGCDNCYAETFAERWRGVPGHPYEQGFDPRLVPEKLGEPLGWKRPRRVFVNSMSDLCHPEVPDGFIGSGWQAPTQVQSIMRTVPTLERIKVFSPTRSNREKFAAEMAERHGITVDPVGSIEEAVRDADIVDLCAPGHFDAKEPLMTVTAGRSARARRQASSFSILSSASSGYGSTAARPRRRDEAPVI